MRGLFGIFALELRCPSLCQLHYIEINTSANINLAEYARGHIVLFRAIR